MWGTGITGIIVTMKRLCFVCLGNICRSPMAEGVFKHLAAEAGRAREFQVESAGVGGWHVGEPADSRAQRVALAHGVRLTSTAQQFARPNFNSFDFVLALDEEVAQSLRRLAASEADWRKVHLLREYDPQARGNLDVPDPYYGALSDFEQVYQIVERSCRQLLDEFSTATSE